MKALTKHREIWLGLAILLLLVIVTARFPRFAQPQNLLTIFNDTSILMMLALGQMVVILTRSIDLSMAANLALTGMIVAMTNAAFPGVPIPLLMAMCVVIGAGLGAFNGVLVWKLSIPPIVVTLGTLTIYRGLVFVISNGAWVNAAQMSPDFINLQRMVFLGLPLLSWFAIVVALLFWLMMTRTPLGRSFYAIGVNPTAAVYTGINVGRTKFILFCLTGLMSGMAAVLLTARLGSTRPSIAEGWELEAITMVVLGGVSILGGAGSIVGVVLAALIMGLVTFGLGLLNVPGIVMSIFIGALLIMVIALPILFRMWRQRSTVRSA